MIAVYPPARLRAGLHILPVFCLFAALQVSGWRTDWAGVKREPERAHGQAQQHGRDR